MKKKPDISLKCTFYSQEFAESKGIKIVLIERKDYYEIHFIFNHKGKFKAFLLASDKVEEKCFNKYYTLYERIAAYEFECQDKWGNEPFNFPIELREAENGLFSDRYKEFKYEKSSHENNVFTTGNNEKMEFIFKDDSAIIITDIKLYNVINEEKGEEIKQTLKYFEKDKNLEIKIIFNKKGKYKLDIEYFDKDMFNKFNNERTSALVCQKLITYYPIVESDAKEFKEYSIEETLIACSFEEILKN